MKRIFQILILFFVSQIYCQEYFDPIENIPEPKIFNSYLVTKTVIDSITQESFISAYQYFDHKGRNYLEYEFNKNGDTIAAIKSNFLDGKNEIQIHSYVNSPSDTAIFIYDKNEKLIEEIWKWGDVEETDRYLFFYDNDKLIKKEVYYGEELSFDSLFYDNDKLIKVISYDNKIKTDSTAYSYQNNLLQLIERFNSKKKLIERFNFQYDNSNNVKRKVQEFYKSEYSNNNRQITSDFYYDEKGKLKKKVVNIFINKRPQTRSSLFYSDTNFIEKIIIENLENQTKTEQIITLHNNG